MKINKEFKIGIFAILIVVITYWGINFLKGVDILSPSHTYYAYYDQSDNIEVSSPILLRGIKIGTVTEVSMEGIDSQVKLILRIDKKYKIPVDSRAMIGNKSMLGGKAIIIELGTSSEILKTEDNIIGVIDDNMTKQIDEVKESLMVMVENLTNTLKGVEELLSDENIENLSGTFANLNNSTSKLDKMLSADEIPTIISNLESLTNELSDAAPSLKSTIANLDNITTQVADTNVGSVVESANQTIEQLNIALQQINSKQGTIGALLYNEEMYNNLNSASENLSNLLLDFTENPKRYVHFSLFGSKEK